MDDPATEMPVVNLSEEHWFAANGGMPPRVGSLVRIWPNHACAVVNHADHLVVVMADGALERWPVDARGCVW